MEAKLIKWGNSVGVRIPHVIIKDLNLKVDDLLSIEKVENKIVMKKVVKNKVSLEKRFTEYQGDNLAKDFSWVVGEKA